MGINEIIKFIYSNTTDDYIIVDCQILEELVENLKNNTKPIYPLDEIKGVIADIKASLPINKEMEDKLEEFVAEIDSKFFNGDKIEEKKILKESVDETFFDWMCSKDFFNEISKQITKKEKCKFDFVKIFNSYTWLITRNDDFEDECLQINMDLRTKDITIHVNKNGKKGKVFKFPQLTFDDSVDELLDIIIHYVKGLLSLHEKKNAKIPNIGYRKMGDIIANMNWDKLDSANFKNMGYRLDDFYVDERFAINQKDYMKAFNKCEDNPKMLGKELSIKATRLADNQSLTIICELDERADVEKLYMYDFNIVEVMLDTF